MQFSCAIFPYKDMCTDKKLNFSDHGYLVQGQIRALNSPYNNKGCPNIEKSMYVYTRRKYIFCHLNFCYLMFFSMIFNIYNNLRHMGAKFNVFGYLILHPLPNSLVGIKL